MSKYSVAVVGSGPSGFYAAAALLAASDLKVRVDLFDRLAAPWGLVRAGVAPDHPKVSQSVHSSRRSPHTRISASSGASNWASM